MIEKIKNVNLIMDYYPGEDLYSDGDVEEQLLDIVKNHDESEFNEIINQEQNWAIMYHLSHVRKNILGVLDITKDMEVLELGAGCGAITGELARRAGKVTCVELSKRRSLINAYRNGDYNNIDIILGNFQEVEKNLAKEFDMITLNGVFEYGQNYIESADPYCNFLRCIKRHLKSNGEVVIAIENRMGMKYWAGCQEDHIGGYFKSIEGYTSDDYARTFTKKELEKIFKTVGFSSYKFFYPYPDYKMPMMIYSDEYLPKKGELTININNFDRDRLVLFDEAKAYDMIIEEGLFPQFSNSFLVVLKNGERNE